MRLVIQKVTNASVTVEGEVVSEIGRGLMVLVGLGSDDGEDEVDWACQKILHVKLFPDAQSKMWRGSVMDLGYEILCVSQFTLFAELRKQERPDFHKAKGATEAKELYGLLLDRMGSMYAAEKIKEGVFGAMMDVALTNDGPVTITLDSADDSKLKRPQIVQPPKSVAQGRKTKGQSKEESIAGGGEHPPEPPSAGAVATT